jgi:hypothetical protein
MKKNNQRIIPKKLSPYGAPLGILGAPLGPLGGPIEGAPTGLLRDSIGGALGTPFHWVFLCGPQGPLGSPIVALKETGACLALTICACKGQIGIDKKKTNFLSSSQLQDRDFLTLTITPSKIERFRNDILMFLPYFSSPCQVKTSIPQIATDTEDTIRNRGVIAY